MWCVYCVSGQPSGEVQASAVTNIVNGSYAALLMNHYPGRLGLQESSDKPPPLVRNSQALEAGSMKPVGQVASLRFLVASATMAHHDCTAMSNGSSDGAKQETSRCESRGS